MLSITQNEFDWKLNEDERKNKCFCFTPLMGEYKLHGHASDITIQEFQC